MLDRTGPTRHRRRAWTYTVAAVAVTVLVAPLAGCGTPDPVNAAAGGKAGGSVPADPVVLRMLNPFDATASEDFVDEVKKASGGQLLVEAVDLWHDEQDPPMKERAVFDAVRSGEEPLGLTSAIGWYDQGVHSFGALYAPMLIDRPEVQTAVLHSDVATDMLTGLEGSGLTGVAILPGPMLHPAGFTRQLVGVADYRGATIITGHNDIRARWLQTLGAVVTNSIDSPDELGSGAIDGAVDAVAMIPGDYATSITTNVIVGPRPSVIAGNPAALAALSDQQRGFLREAAQATIDVRDATERNREAGDAGVLCRRGTVAFDRADPAQLDALHASTEPVYQWLREDPATSGFLDRIRQLADTTPVDPDRVIDCPAGPTSASPAAAPSTAGPVDGTYTVTLTKQDLQAAGVPADSILPENWGEVVYVLDHGRFATTQHNDQTCTWGYGRYTTDGDTITFDYDDGGGQALTGAVNRPGEELAYRWSLYRGVLTLTNQPAAVSPIPPGAQLDLTQIETTPDRSALNQQCPPPAVAFAN